MGGRTAVGSVDDCRTMPNQPQFERRETSSPACTPSESGDTKLIVEERLTQRRGAAEKEEMTVMSRNLDRVLIIQMVNDVRCLTEFGETCRGRPLWRSAIAHQRGPAQRPVPTVSNELSPIAAFTILSEQKEHRQCNATF